MARSSEKEYRSLLSACTADRLSPAAARPRTEQEILHSRQPAHAARPPDARRSNDIFGRDCWRTRPRGMAISLEVARPSAIISVSEYRGVCLARSRWGRCRERICAGLYRRVPRNIVERTKRGFRPARTRRRVPLRDWAEALLSIQAPQQRSQSAPIASAWNDLQTGRRQSGCAWGAGFS